MTRVSDINVIETAVLPSPELLQREIRRNEEQARTVSASRTHLHDIIFGDDRRFLVVVGPCSIHDLKAGLEYARRLSSLARELQDRLYLVMRVYFEKPRTTIGWKGLIMDPHMDGSADIFAGLRLARSFLRDVVDLGLPTATELLDPITPQYIADFVSWSAIGARTTESQTHRQMASGLSMPLGFKNATSGNLQVAINAIKAARQPQTFLGISMQGLASAIVTRGNANCHIILRGGEKGPNYSAESIDQVRRALLDNGLLPAIMVDCSHDNSGKDPARQTIVLQSITDTLMAGQTALIGAMIESNLVSGHQPIPALLSNLVYGQSITDPCLGWEQTESMLRELHARLAPRWA